MTVYILSLILSDGSSVFQDVFSTALLAVKYAEKMSETQLGWETFGDSYFLGHDFIAGETWEITSRTVIDKEG